MGVDQAGLSRGCWVDSASRAPTTGPWSPCQGPPLPPGAPGVLARLLASAELEPLVRRVLGHLPCGCLRQAVPLVCRRLHTLSRGVHLEAVHVVGAG